MAAFSTLSATVSAAIVPASAATYNAATALPPLLRVQYRADAGPFRCQLRFKAHSTADSCTPLTRITLKEMAKSATPSDMSYVPDSDLYKVEAILRPSRIPAVTTILMNMDIPWMTVSQTQDFMGRDVDQDSGLTFLEEYFEERLKLEVLVTKNLVEEVIDKIVKFAMMGESPCGKIFVIPVADVISCSTRARGAKALGMTDGE